MIPEIKYADKITDISVSGYDARVVAYEESAKQGEQSKLSKVFADMNIGQSAVFVIGPEGGVSDDEINQLTAHNFISAGLGPRILRTETAPFYVLAAASYHFELSH
ncbi:ribosomal RNA small subunit methyltransferase E [Lentilactobacillus kosonis]|uniref:Ribosomal RNA small subunit methyltransferase E n=1 Tax=Lentilactobacillus kosonis TaxID=2810561 RepID=A0A401FLF5_9LACO|nr:ribosomal RNA small subunit methyltransferase E [Lentilactobacillus kosonis]